METSAVFSASLLGLSIKWSLASTTSAFATTGWNVLRLDSDQQISGIWVLLLQLSFAVVAEVEFVDDEMLHLSARDARFLLLLTFFTLLSLLAWLLII